MTSSTGPAAGHPRFPRDLPATIALGLLLLSLAATAPAFFQAGNLRDLAVLGAPVLLVASGMTLVMLVGEIDISVGSQFAICSVLAASAAKAGVPVLLLPVLIMGAGALLGALNGALVAYLRLPSIIVTLAMLVFWRDLLRWITSGAWVQGLPLDFQWLGVGPTIAQAAIVLTAAVLTVGMAWVLRHRRAGREFFAVGADAESARLIGIDPPRVVFNAFTTLGGLVGLAAALNAVRFTSVPANLGAGLEMKAIAAVVVGGAAITGGRASLRGTLVGVALLGSIGNALSFLGINPFWEKAMQGGVLIAAMAAELVVTRVQSRSARAVHVH